jgi:hypothetical protein
MHVKVCVSYKQSGKPCMPDSEFPVETNEGVDSTGRQSQESISGKS